MVRAATEAYRGRVLEQMERASDAERSTVKEQLSGACTTEIAAFDEFVGLLAGDGSAYDHIVFDTAPTGHGRSPCRQGTPDCWLRSDALLHWHSLFDGNRNPLCRHGRQRPAQVAVSGVVEHVGRDRPRPTRGSMLGSMAAAQAQGGHAAHVHAREALAHPVHQRADAVGPRMSRFSPLNSAVPATRKRSGPRRLVTSLVASSSRLTCGAAARLAFVVQVHGDGVALDRVDVHAVAQRGREPAAGHGPAQTTTPSTWIGYHSSVAARSSSGATGSQRMS